jgi:hypothetical protein
LFPETLEEVYEGVIGKCSELAAVVELNLLKGFAFGFGEEEVKVDGAGIREDSVDGKSTGQLVVPFERYKTLGSKECDHVVASSCEALSCSATPVITNKY